MKEYHANEMESQILNDESCGKDGNVDVQGRMSKKHILPQGASHLLRATQWIS